ncbi:hypothetical protein HZA44_00435 [Candidatus Peregrinibacteria bacterium]|nr:hypothetical protein [Candidatus Peregrinibacteria bacterium]
MADPRFDVQTLTIRRKIFSLTNFKFHLYDPSGKLAFYSEMKAFKLKEDIRLYSDESMTEELLNIHARTIIDFSAIYDVMDSKTGEKVGALKRKGMQSMIKDEWAILDNNDAEIGIIAEDSMPLALLRRFLVNLIPQSYDFTLRGTMVGTFHQNFNPFVEKITLDFSADTGHILDHRLGIAAGLLLSALERRQR